MTIKTKKNKSSFHRETVRYIGIFMSASLMGIAYSWFLLPYNIAPGGLGGISQVVNHFTGIPFGISMIVLNIPLFVISFVHLGKAFGGKSLWGMLCSAFMVDVLSIGTLHKLGIIKDITQYTHTLENGRVIVSMLPPGDIYLSAIAGSVLLGIGLGLIFRFRGSTGGTDIPVAMIKQKAGLSIGTGYWLVETVIILSVGIILSDLRLIIWGYINLFITSRLTDLASEGLPYVKGVYLISKEPEKIKDKIYSELNRGVTFLKGVSGFHKRDLDVIFCVLNRRQVLLLTDIVKEVDPDAFMIVTDVSDVMGYGFKTRKINLEE
jgi:uncharacterized membrane-anchored protein YitT (DUF2179 family)